MGQALTLHPDSRCIAVARIEVDVARPRPGDLELHYVVTGKISDLRMPPVTDPARQDELWRHTCFEAFLRAAPEDAYYEFNFAPSTAWAAYRFGGYRSGMSRAAKIGAPGITVHGDGAGYELRASLALDRAPDLPSDAPWRLGLAAVIEETDGRTSYWALTHPPGPPDFHHADGFARELPALERP